MRKSLCVLLLSQAIVGGAVSIMPALAESNASSPPIKSGNFLCTETAAGGVVFDQSKWQSAQLTTSRQVIVRLEFVRSQTQTSYDRGPRMLHDYRISIRHHNGPAPNQSEPCTERYRADDLVSTTLGYFVCWSDLTNTDFHFSMTAERFMTVSFLNFLTGQDDKQAAIAGIGVGTCTRISD